MDAKNQQATREVLTDLGLEAGLYKIGRRYHIRTLSYQYTGTLVAVDALVYLFKDTATVYETGEYKNFFESGGRKAKDVQPHTGGGEMLIDRAGVVLQLFIDDEKK